MISFISNNSFLHKLNGSRYWYVSLTHKVLKCHWINQPKDLQTNPISALNNPQRVDMPLDKLTQRLINASNFSISSSSSCRAISTDIPDSLFQLVFKATSCISTELLYVGSSWSSCFCSSMWRGPQEYAIYGFVPTSPVVSRMSSLSILDIFCDGGG